MSEMILYKLDNNFQLVKVATFENSLKGFPEIVNLLLKKYHFNYIVYDIYNDLSLLDQITNFLNTNSSTFYDVIIYSFFSQDMFINKDLPILSSQLLKFIQYNKEYTNIDDTHLKAVYKELVKLTMDKNLKAIMLSMTSDNDVWEDTFVDKSGKIYQYPKITDDDMKPLGVKILKKKDKLKFLKMDARRLKKYMK